MSDEKKVPDDKPKLPPYYYVYKGIVESVKYQISGKRLRSAVIKLQGYDYRFEIADGGLDDVAKVEPTDIVRVYSSSCIPKQAYEGRVLGVIPGTLQILDQSVRK